ncbi:MAG: S-methyl-5-thioribose-1-phosphate isomerase [Betaproteobacteria bacterium]|nr:S-methyl-5-thioribose-1-phosphate isomerase [Betaproteobacteria bacterium]
MAAAAVETLRWAGERLELIDQRLLPQRVEYRACHDASEVAEAIRNLVVRGAPAIGCAAAYGIALAALRAGAMHQPLSSALPLAFELLAASRPTAVNLFWALARMRRCWEARAIEPDASVAAHLVAEARAIHTEDVATNQRLGRLGAELLPASCRVLTHCNAGALATAGYGTALGVIRAAVAAGKHVEVIADETRPVLQGARLTAWELQQERIPVTLIADGAAGYLMSRGEIDAVIVGADRVAANGDVANKVGTYMVATAAHRHGIPFYVACPVSTLDISLASGADIPIEERAPAEVLGFNGASWSPAGVAVRNPAFDVTPAELVTALITERGVARAPYLDAIRKLVGLAGVRW